MQHINAAIAREDHVQIAPSDQELLHAVSEIRAHHPGLGRAKLQAILRAQDHFTVSEQRL